MGLLSPRCVITPMARAAVNEAADEVVKKIYQWLSEIPKTDNKEGPFIYGAACKQDERR